MERGKQKHEWDRNQIKGLKQSRQVSTVSLWGDLLESNKKTRGSFIFRGKGKHGEDYSGTLHSMYFVWRMEVT